jgi:hypothetical protein
MHPSLICIGPQRCGTTWLFRRLRLHPDVFAPIEKELHFFDHHHVPLRAGFLERRQRRAAERLGWGQYFPPGIAVPGLGAIRRVAPDMPGSRWLQEMFWRSVLPDGGYNEDWYRGLFAKARPGQVSLDFTASYCMLGEDGIRHILNINPQARILMMVRNPVERAYSHYKMVKKKQTDKTLDLAQFKRRVLDAGSAISQQNNYAGNITRWRRAVPEAQFKIMFYEDLEADPTTYMAEVCDFAGLSHHPRLFRKAGAAIYPSGGPEMPAEVRAFLQQHYAPEIGALAEYFPERQTNFQSWLAR